MDYSAANHELWNVIVQFGYIAAVILIAVALTDDQADPQDHASDRGARRIYPADR